MTRLVGRLCWPAGVGGRGGGGAGGGGGGGGGHRPGDRRAMDLRNKEISGYGAY